MKGLLSKHTALKVDRVIEGGKYTVSRRDRTSFSQEHLQAGAVKGLRL